jgi:hypothetical protein
VTFVCRLDKPIDLSRPGLSVSPDGRSLLFTQEGPTRKRHYADGKLPVTRPRAINPSHDPPGIRKQAIPLSLLGSLYDGVLLWQVLAKSWLPAETGSFSICICLNRHERQKARGSRSLLWNLRISSLGLIDFRSPTEQFYGGLHQASSWRFPVLGLGGAGRSQRPKCYSDQDE